MTTIARRMHDLTVSRAPFVHATVVRAQDPTSARPGDDAVILPDGTIEGFVGGMCAESSVRAAALDALRDGTALLLRVLPDGAPAFPDTPGARVVVNPCHSGGALEIFLRPVLPVPVLGLVGDTPISAAVATLAAFLDFEVATSGDHSGATAVVVAGLGKGEQDAVRAALDAGVGHIALVASRTRGAAVLDELALSDAERARSGPRPDWRSGRAHRRRSRCRSWPRWCGRSGWTASPPPPHHPRRSPSRQSTRCAG